MPQSVIIQTEPASTVSAKKAPAASKNSDREAFSAHFNQQIRDDNKSGKADTGSAGKTANTAESDKTIAADGKNLPSDKAQGPDADNNGEAGTEKSASNDTGTSDSGQADTQVAHADGSETVDSEKDTGETMAVPTMAANTTTQTATSNASDKTTDKPVRAEVSVSQKAVDNAKAAPVSMTAKALTQQEAVKAGSDNQKLKVSAEQTQTASQETVKTRVDAPVAKLPEVAPVDKTALPNLAAALKQLAQDDGGSPKIRADILDALQRQQGKPEVTANLRNLIAAQLQQAEAKMPVPGLQAATPSVLSESSSPLLNTASTINTMLAGSQPGTGPTAALTQPGFSLPVQPSMQNPAWGQVMSSRVIWMAKEGVQEAELRMNPARLGPVEVKLHVQNDQASVTFLAQQSATREALEQALPRLRESFADSGMQLTDAQVGEQEQHQQEESEQTGDSQIFSQARGQDDDIDTEAVETVSSGEEPRGLSLYA